MHKIVDRTQHLLDWLVAHPLPENASVSAQAGIVASDVAVFPYNGDALNQVRRVLGPLEEATDPGGRPMLTSDDVDGVQVRVWVPIDDRQEVPA